MIRDKLYQAADVQQVENESGSVLESVIDKGDVSGVDKMSKSRLYGGQLNEVVCG